jgi:hypothetical protein
VFGDLDDDVEPANANATIHGETAIAVAAPAVVNDTDNETAMDVASADANEMFSNMGITAVYDTIFNDEEEVTTAADTEPSETNTEDYEIEEDSLYARDLPTPNMTSWIISDVRTDTTFTEMWETYHLHMEDKRAMITVQLIEWR